MTDTMIMHDSDSDTDGGETTDCEYLYAQKPPTPQTRPLWNRFRSAPRGTESFSQVNTKRRQKFLNVIKVLVCGLVFSLILGCGCIAKVTTMLMTSQVKIKRRPYCTWDMKNDITEDVNLSDPERASWMWAIFFSFLFPEVLALIRSLRIWFFKSSMKPKIPDLLIVTLLESASVTGVTLLVFVVLPEMNAVKGVMITNCVCLVPAVLGFIYRLKGNKKRSMVRLFLDVLAVVLQISGLILWVVVDSDISMSNRTTWCLPVALLLASFGWWENYVKECVDETFIKLRQKSVKLNWMPQFIEQDQTQESEIQKKEHDGFYTKLGKLKYRVRKSRYAIYSFISLWKMALFFSEFLIFAQYINGDDVTSIFTDFIGRHDLNITEGEKSYDFSYYFEEGIADGLTPTIKSSDFTPFYVLISHCAAGWICYFCAKFAVKIRVQRFCYALPVALVVPFTSAFLIGMCVFKEMDCRKFTNFMPAYLFWNCPLGENFAEEFFFHEAGYMWVFWLISQLWITHHLWFPHIERLATTDRIFVTPMYSSILIDQSLALNRARDDVLEISSTHQEHAENVEAEESASDVEAQELPPKPNIEKGSDQKNDKMPMIYACATMWHESANEMLEMLKSLCRMDLDLATKRNAKKVFSDTDMFDDDCYEFEANIFFDDAFTGAKDTMEYRVNDFVKTFMKVIKKCKKRIYPEHMGRIKPPMKYPTPYGGRLEYTLPGGTKLIVHLKNKDLIRHKKRWSQVMYMYYLLGLRLLDLPDIDKERKQVIAENTYVLALDGDIDFQPDAVYHLLNLMKRDGKLGAACGRIHPTGKGPIVWYQMFEYAIGHWLQKATEHVIGCVLCSPGCFSLFRAKALMDDGVMKQYTKVSNKPRHHVQYDQGEDRWLCTLLLQRGYRVEYGAASDAYTHAPTGFRDFFNQRRRWIPSTIANIMDLLQDSKNTIKNNDNISVPYIMYQCMMMVGTVLGPGTIFLMMIGAFNSAFGISMYASLGWNLVPIVLFMAVCLFCKKDVQLFFAELLSAIYALVMMAVIVGIAIQMTDDGLLSPTSIMFLAILGSFVITAMMHPLEFNCLFPFIIYYLLTPSMYLLLIIFALFNMNDVSWGTREGGSSTPAAPENKPKQLTSAQKLLNNGKEEEDSGIDFSCAGLFRIQCCTHNKPDISKEIVEIKDTLRVVVEKIDDSGKKQVAVDSRKLKRMGSTGGSRWAKQVGIYGSSDDESSSNISDSDMDSEEEQPRRIRERVRSVLTNPFWLEEDEDMKKGPTDFLEQQEIVFWEDLIKAYLAPIDKDSKKEQEMAKQLKELRNKMAFFFVMVNALFVLIIFLVQMNNDKLYVTWPLGVKSDFIYSASSQTIVIQNEYLTMEPIGLTFVFFFATILVIQVTCMFIHQWTTIEGILAASVVTWCGTKSKENEENNKTELKEYMINFIRSVIYSPSVTDEGSVARDDSISKRRTIHELTKEENPSREARTVDDVVDERMERLATTDFARNVSFRPKYNRSRSAFQGNFNRLQETRQSTIHAAVRRFHTANAERLAKRRGTLTTLSNGHENNNIYGSTPNMVFTSGKDNHAYDHSDDEP